MPDKKQKRPRCDCSTSEGSQKKEKTADETQRRTVTPPQQRTSAPISFKNVFQGKKVDIFHHNYTEGNLLTEQINAIEEAILPRKDHYVISQ